MNPLNEHQRVQREINTMSTIYAALRVLDEAERDRVMGWVSARLASDCKVGRPDELAKLRADAEREYALGPDTNPFPDLPTGRNEPCGQCAALPHRPHADDCPDLISPFNDER